MLVDFVMKYLLPFINTKVIQSDRNHKIYCTIQGVHSNEHGVIDMIHGSWVISYKHVLEFIQFLPSCKCAADRVDFSLHNWEQKFCIIWA